MNSRGWLYRAGSSKSAGPRGPRHEIRDAGEAPYRRRAVLARPRDRSRSAWNWPLAAPGRYRPGRADGRSRHRAPRRPVHHGLQRRRAPARSNGSTRPRSAPASRRNPHATCSGRADCSADGCRRRSPAQSARTRAPLAGFARQQRRLGMRLLEILDDGQRLGQRARLVLQRRHQRLRIELAIDGAKLLAAALAADAPAISPIELLQLQRDAHAIGGGRAEIAVEASSRRPSRSCPCCRRARPADRSRRRWWRPASSRISMRTRSPNCQERRRRLARARSSRPCAARRCRHSRYRQPRPAVPVRHSRGWRPCRSRRWCRRQARACARHARSAGAKSNVMSTPASRPAEQAGR